MRGVYRPLRHRLNYPHRHKDKQPDEFPVFVPGEEDGQPDRRVMFPVNAYPHIHYFLEMPPPARMLGTPPDAHVGPGPRHVRFDVSLPMPWNGLMSFSTPDLDLFSFARMLAKIGHSFAVAELGFGNFKPLLRDVILNEADDLFHYVGGVGDLKLPPTKEPYVIAMGALTTAETRFVIVRVRLFATVDEAPLYQIVVGEIAKQP